MQLIGHVCMRVLRRTIYKEKIEETDKNYIFFNVLVLEM